MTKLTSVTHCWVGRDDSNEGIDTKRLHQIVQSVNIDDSIVSTNKASFALLGFACDLGVARNKGRVGARKAPNVLRENLANFAYHSQQQWLDFGNYLPSTDSLELAQQEFSSIIQQLHQDKLLNTLVLGGGHETAYPHALGLFKAYPDKKIGIINFDAHLDMRNTLPVNSGTPFLQLAQYCETAQQEFHYLCIGVSKANNTQNLLNIAKSKNVNIIYDLDAMNLAYIDKQIKKFITQLDYVYLTLDLDVLNASEMFAVSAPSSFGVGKNELIHWIELVGKSNKLIAADIVEYNPDYDQDNRCAKLASRLVYEISQYLISIK